MTPNSTTPWKRTKTTHNGETSLSSGSRYGTAPRSTHPFPNTDTEKLVFLPVSGKPRALSTGPNFGAQNAPLASVTSTEGSRAKLPAARKTPTQRDGGDHGKKNISWSEPLRLPTRNGAAPLRVPPRHSKKERKKPFRVYDVNVACLCVCVVAAHAPCNERTCASSRTLPRHGGSVGRPDASDAALRLLGKPRGARNKSGASRRSSSNLATVSRLACRR